MFVFLLDTQTFIYQAPVSQNLKSFSDLKTIVTKVISELKSLSRPKIFPETGPRMPVLVLFQDTSQLIMVFDVLQRLGYKTVTGEDVTEFDFLYTRIHVFDSRHSNRTSRQRYHSRIVVSGGYRSFV